MSQYLNDITVTVNWLIRQKLDRKWNTERFAKIHRIVPFSRIYFPVAGYGTVTHQGKVFELTPGKILLVPAFAEVKCFCPDHLEKYWCHFNAFLGKSSPDIFALNRTCIELPVPDREFLSLLFDHLIALSTRTEPVRQFEFTAAMRLLLARFLDKVSWTENENTLPFFTRLLIYIGEHLHEELSLKTLAGHVGICPSHLSHRFHDKMGMKLFEYITINRMYKAMFLLRAKQYSVSEISDLTGFSNISVFSKSFKRHTGYSPLEFRKYFMSLPSAVDVVSSFRDPEVMQRVKKLQNAGETRPAGS
ncbi:MAG: helix-turn-helix transcriptional regulator [Lentisphaeria bacterium]|nr:helix-turn-helix transcriptional regulator [Lentisphaeria bacterium]